MIGLTIRTTLRSEVTQDKDLTLAKPARLSLTINFRWSLLTHFVHVIKGRESNLVHVIKGREYDFGGIRFYGWNLSRLCVQDEL